MRTLWVMGAVLALLTGGPARAEMRQDAYGRTLVAEAVGALLQADGRRALAILEAAPRAGYDAKTEAFRACVVGRLRGDGPDPAATIPEPVTRSALQAYQRYWRAAALDLSAREPEEAKLLAELRRITGREDLQDLDAAEPVVAERLKTDGYYSQQGVTGRLRDLMIWSKQTEKSYPVSLPEGDHRTRVLFLDGFRSRGWSAYLDCERATTGGWATAESLYAIVPAYESLEDESFKVSFLGHESQHFADKNAFKDIKSWELEYRAKLVELALADGTRGKILARFTSSQGDDPGEPHSYANRRVLAAVRQRLGVTSDADLQTVALDRLHAAATAELKADTARRAQLTSARAR